MSWYVCKSLSFPLGPCLTASHSTFLFFKILICIVLRISPTLPNHDFLFHLIHYSSFIFLLYNSILIRCLHMIKASQSIYFILVIPFSIQFIFHSFPFHSGSYILGFIKASYVAFNLLLYFHDILTYHFQIIMWALNLFSFYH